MNEETAWRYRVNAERTASGKWKFDATVEGPDAVAVLEQHQKVMDILAARYGVVGLDAPVEMEPDLVQQLQQSIEAAKAEEPA